MNDNQNNETNIKIGEDYDVGWRDRQAVYKAAGSMGMLIFNIVYTIEFIISIISNFPWSIVNNILPALTLVGLWWLWASSKSKKASTASIRFIQIPFIITSIVYLIIPVILCIVFGISFFAVLGDSGGPGEGFPLLLLVCFLVSIVYFIFNLAFVCSINGVMKDGINTLNGHAPDKKPGIFAAVIIIIEAVLISLPSIVFGISGLMGGVIVNSILEAISFEVPDFILTALSSYTILSSVMTIISGVMGLIYYGFAGFLIVSYRNARNDAKNL